MALWSGAACIELGRAPLQRIGIQDAGVDHVAVRAFATFDLVQYHCLPGISNYKTHSVRVLLSHLSQLLALPLMGQVALLSAGSDRKAA